MAAKVISLAGRAKKADPYDLEERFERVVVTMACGMPGFYGRIGNLLDPECVSLEPSKWALRAAFAIYTDNTEGPESALVVLQRLKRWVREGKLTNADLAEVSDLFDAAEDAGLLSEEAAVNELAPILRRRMELDAVRHATAQFGKGEGLEEVSEMLEQASRIGVSDTSVGMCLGPESGAVAASMRGLSRMKTGIMELDDAMDGGYVRGSTVVYLAETSGGKSMALVQGAVSAAQQGLNAAYATLELSIPIVLARILANITGVPVNDILFTPGCSEEATKRLASIQKAGFGSILFKAFTPQVSTVTDILEWVKTIEKTRGSQIDVLIVDYGDKVAAPKKAKDKDTSSYKTGLYVFEGFSVWSRDNNRWCLTASQANRGKKKDRSGKKSNNDKLETDDVADSMHKVRVVPVVITLNKRGEEGDQVYYHVAKNTFGKAGMGVGPLPTEYECARISPVTYPYVAPTV